jgi:hypothetical protein
MGYTARQAQIIIDHGNTLTTTGYMHEQIHQDDK